jgi:hypothetical protein
VVYTNIETPNYGVSQGPKTHDDHASPTDVGGGNNPPPAYDDTPGGPQAITQPGHRPPPPTPITVGVQPTAVVIDGNTIHDNPAQPTQVVIIADQTFTIDPTRVVGGGATIDRPAATGGIYVPTPTSTNLGGIPVVISSSVAVIGGSSFTLGNPSPTTATISGQTFTINPTNIAGASQTIPIPTLPRPTEVVVAGGDLITAIGRSVLVIHGTTITYFPSGGGGTPSPPTTLIVDGETLTLGPGGVTAHGGALTIGGSQASSPHDTQYALVGGATITKIGASVVVIRDVTYTVGPGTGTTTTLIGGESVTIAPGGVEVGTLSLGFPFGVTTVITPGAGPTAGGAMATAGAGGEEEDGVGAVRPWLVGVGGGGGVALAGGVVVCAFRFSLSLSLSLFLGGCRSFGGPWCKESFARFRCLFVVLCVCASKSNVSVRFGSYALVASFDSLRMTAVARFVSEGKDCCDTPRDNGEGDVRLYRPSRWKRTGAFCV